jgi:hypothetical protein
MKVQDALGNFSPGWINEQMVADVDAPDDQYVTVQSDLTCRF